MQALPTFIESGGHPSVAAWLDNAVAIQTIAAEIIRRWFMGGSSLSVMSPPLYARLIPPDAGRDTTAKASKGAPVAIGQADGLSLRVRGFPCVETSKRCTTSDRLLPPTRSVRPPSSSSAS